MSTLLTLVPFAGSEPFRIVELGSGDGRLSAALLDAFPHAALDGARWIAAACARRRRRGRQRSAIARASRRSSCATRRLVGNHLRRRRRRLGADACIISTTPKKQYVYKAVADRLSPRGALLIADLVAPAHAVRPRARRRRLGRGASAQAARSDAPGSCDRFTDARWNHFRYPDRADHPAALFHHLVWLRHAGFCGGRLLVAVRGARRVRRPQRRRAGGIGVTWEAARTWSGGRFSSQ